MAPSPITTDYYMVLEVEQTATPELIIKSYKRLALKLHPDRNAKHDATQAFQLLGLAYETLNDGSKRQAYDLIYPSLTRRHPSSPNTQTSRPPSASTSQSEALKDAAQIAALEKLKQERGARWRTKKNIFDSSIFELQRGIRQVEQGIKNLDSIVAAEAAIEARKNSWGTWLLSPISKKVEEDTEEEKARKDRERQERRIEKDMKERRLASKKADLKREENLSRMGKEEIDAADLCDDGKIRVIQARIWARETRERQEREQVERERIAKLWKQQQEQREQLEKVERERMAKVWKQAQEQREQREKVERERMAKVWKQEQEQREKREREAAEALRKQQAENRAAQQKRKEEETRKWRENLINQYTHPNLPEGSTRQAYTSTCRHDGWWPKVQGRTACPECAEIWTYLLHCPGCKMKACPRCQAVIRPRIQRNAARTNRRVPSRARTPSPDFNNDYEYGW